MLKIRHLQMAELDEAIDAAFTREVARHMRDEHAEDVAHLSDDDLFERVTAGIDRARSYGMTWDTTILAFVAIQLTVARDFDREPSIRRVLTDPFVPPNARVDALWERTSDEDWERAASREREERR
jgi:hypothetical protein